MKISKRQKRRGVRTPRENQLDPPGLIDELDFSRDELHGFEVDLDGRVVIPESFPARRGSSPLEQFQRALGLRTKPRRIA